MLISEKYNYLFNLIFFVLFCIVSFNFVPNLELYANNNISNNESIDTSLSKHPIDKTINEHDNKNKKNNIKNTALINLLKKKGLETGSLIDIDGNFYTTVKIGNQWWMAENLKVTHYHNGDPIPYVSGNIEWSSQSRGAFCYYDNNKSYADTFGALYNWFAVNDSRSIAPKGWHVPTDEEWKILVDYLGGSDMAGGELKSTDIQLWTNPNTGAINSSGFTALPGGYRDETGFFGRMNYYAFFWSATGHNYFRSWYYSLRYFYSDVSHYKYHHGSGLSIRLVKD